MNVGKQLRLGRFRLRHSRFGIIVPVDHGLTLGPIEGIESAEQISRWIACCPISGIIAHKGMIERLAARRALDGVGVMMHLTGMSAMAPDPDRKLRVTCIETAVRCGADAVSLQVNFDGKNDAHNLKLMGAVVDEAQPYGLPVLAMVYDTKPDGSKDRMARQRHLIRIAVELGVDAVKIAAPEALSEIPELLAGLARDVAIFFAGGSVRSEGPLLALAHEAAISGAAGLCVGRNVFQRERPDDLIEQVRRIFEDIEVSGFERVPPARPMLASAS